MTTEIPTLFAFDPGGVHVGFARFELHKANGPKGWTCVDAREFTPTEAGRFLTSQLPFVDIVVYETFQLYPDKAMSLVGSEMETSQMIGVIKWIVNEYNGPTQLIELVQQPASVQEPTKGLLRNRDIRSEAKARQAGGHALSAELHGWAFLIKNGLVN